MTDNDFLLELYDTIISPLLSGIIVGIEQPQQLAKIF